MYEYVNSFWFHKHLVIFFLICIPVPVLVCTVLIWFLFHQEEILAFFTAVEYSVYNKFLYTNIPYPIFNQWRDPKTPRRYSVVFRKS
jgi:hypothetical protein